MTSPAASQFAQLKAKSIDEAIAGPFKTFCVNLMAKTVAPRNFVITGEHGQSLAEGLSSAFADAKRRFLAPRHTLIQDIISRVKTLIAQGEAPREVYVDGDRNECKLLNRHLGHYKAGDDTPLQAQSPPDPMDDFRLAAQFSLANHNIAKCEALLREQDIWSEEGLEPNPAARITI